MTDEKTWRVAEIITRARINEAWGTYGERRFAQLNWPRTEPERRAYQHNKVAEIDLALASAVALIQKGTA